MEGARTAIDSQLSALVGVATEPSGLSTFARYRWQAKQAVRLWLTCLSGRDPALCLVCEHVEDVVVVGTERFRFIQLKTRDRGSWSAAAMCDRGLDSLVRSYSAARTHGIHERSTFELWVEGPLSDHKVTTGFAAAPATAGPEIRRKIVAHGLGRGEVADFLARLEIHAGQPSTAHIDAKAIRELGALWPLSQIELEQVYGRLLDAAEAAQAGEQMPGALQGHLAAAADHLGHDLPQPGESGADLIEPIREQILSHHLLLSLTPPLRRESNYSLLQRIRAGTTASLLELKLIRAGASPETIAQAQKLRATMELRRQLQLASVDSAVDRLDQLTQRMLSMAEATSRRISMAAAASPVLGMRSGEAIAAELLSRPSDLAQCDRDDLFGRDAEQLFGYLCHLSDECRFGWGVAG